MRIGFGLVLVAALAISPAAATQAQAAAIVEVPLRLHGGKMVVPVEAADGTTLELLVGTGSITTVLSESGATRFADRGGLTLGGVPVPTDGAPTLADEDLTVDGKTFDGMVSSNTLNRFDVLFDVPGGRLLLKEIGRAVTWEGVELSEPVPLRVYHGAILALDVKLDGRQYPAMLDLGTASLVVNERVGAEAAIDDGTATLELGATTFVDLPVEVRDLPVFRRFSPSGEGFVLVGAPIAVDCVLSISYVHRELRTCVR